MSDTSPCMNCALRSVGCHSSCGDYSQWLKMYEEIKQKRVFENQKEQFARPLVLRRRYG